VVEIHGPQLVDDFSKRGVGGEEEILFCGERIGHSRKLAAGTDPVEVCDDRGMRDSEAVVTSVNRDDAHRFTKPPRDHITLLEGLGVEGDSHAGLTVQHRSRLEKHGDDPNLRQVHLIAEELFNELAAKGYTLTPGDLGENVTTRGVDLLGLPRGTRLRLGSDAVIELTGLRNPCLQIDRFRTGLLKEVVGRDEGGNIVRRAGVMSIVLAGGRVAATDVIRVELPAEPHIPLDYV
jgi:MOSC domain-containing protein YiiM